MIRSLVWSGELADPILDRVLDGETVAAYCLAVQENAEKVMYWSVLMVEASTEAGLPGEIRRLTSIEPIFDTDHVMSTEEHVDLLQSCGHTAWVILRKGEQDDIANITSLAADVIAMSEGQATPGLPPPGGELA